MIAILRLYPHQGETKWRAYSRPVEDSRFDEVYPLPEDWRAIHYQDDECLKAALEREGIHPETDIIIGHPLRDLAVIRSKV